MAKSIQIVEIEGIKVAFSDGANIPLEVSDLKSAMDQGGGHALRQAAIRSKHASLVVEETHAGLTP